MLQFSCVSRVIIMFSFVLFVKSIYSANAQDYIVLKNGKKIEAKVTGITFSEIQYKSFDNIDGPTKTISRRKVFAIDYVNGYLIINPIPGKTYTRISRPENEEAEQRKRETIAARQEQENEAAAQREREVLAAKQAKEKEEAEQRKREALAATQAQEKEEAAQREREALAAKHAQEKEEAAQREREALAAKQAQEKEEAAEREREALAARQAQEKEEAAQREREALAARLAQNKPPAVSIINPINRSTIAGEQVRIVYDVSETMPTSVRISVDGRAVQLITDAKLGENEVMVDVPDKDFDITIVAQSQFGASVPATVNLNRSRHIFKPSLYILAIGISNYDNPDLRLQYPAKDASDFAQALIRQGGLMYERVYTQLLFDRSATAENIRDGLSWLQTETTSRDIAMLYIAGHGINDNVGDFFFMPVNADMNRINATCVSYVDIKRTTSAVAGKLIVFMDACHSGNVMGNTLQRAALISQAVTELTSADSGPVVFTSSTGRQFSLESPEWNNGAFTKALVEGLTGKADLIGNKTITIKSLDYYITTRVKELTNGRQAPTTIIPRSIPDFPIAVIVD